MKKLKRFSHDGIYNYIWGLSSIYVKPIRLAYDKIDDGDMDMINRRLGDRWITEYNPLKIDAVRWDISNAVDILIFMQGMRCKFESSVRRSFISYAEFEPILTDNYSIEQFINPSGSSRATPSPSPTNTSVE